MDGGNINTLLPNATFCLVALRYLDVLRSIKLSACDHNVMFVFVFSQAP